MALHINKIVFKHDKEKISNLYDIFLLKKDSGYIKTISNIFSLEDENLLSIYWSSEKGERCVYLLMKKDVKNKSELIKRVSELENDYVVQPCSSHEISDHILLNLLLNALPHYNKEKLGYSNIIGKLFINIPSKEKLYPDGRRKKISLLKLYVNKDMTLSLDIATFTNTKEFSKKEIGKYPRFSLFNTSLGLILKKDTGDGSDTFMYKVKGNTKTEVPFFKILSTTEYEKYKENNFDDKTFFDTKLGIFFSLLDTFSSSYSDIANITLEEVKDFITYAKEETLSLEKIANENDIYIVDKVNTPESKEKIDEISSLYFSLYEKKLKKCTSIKKDKENIVLIHNKEFYDGEGDKHKEMLNVNYITYEDFDISPSNAKSLFKTILKELAIKDDLKRGKISIIDWSSFSFSSTFTFGYCYKADDETKHFLVMKISPDGSFSIDEEDVNSLFCKAEYKGAFSENTLMFIENDKGEINKIDETNLFSVPDVPSYIKHLKNVGYTGRGKEAKEEFFSSSVGVNYFEKEGSAYYFVGSKENLNINFLDKRCIIRKVSPYNDSPLFFQTLLSLMSVDFVRLGSLTVYPFPYKYLREWGNAKFLF